MKIKNAAMEVVDRFDRRLPGHPPIRLKASDGQRIDCFTTLRDSTVTVEIRRYTTNPERAAELGHETGDDEVLTDWFVIIDARLSFYGGSLSLVGYMEGVEGTLRDGVHPVSGKSNVAPYDDIARPMVRVRWDLR